MILAGYAPNAFRHYPVHNVWLHSSDVPDHALSKTVVTIYGGTKTACVKPVLRIVMCWLVAWHQFRKLYNEKQNIKLTVQSGPKIYKLQQGTWPNYTAVRKWTYN